VVLPDPPKPAYWKAAAAAAFPVFFASLILRLIFHNVPAPLWWFGTIAAVLALAYTVHRKMLYDSGAQWSMNFAETDRANYTPPDVTVRKK
jgi:hypothetical protein